MRYVYIGLAFVLMCAAMLPSASAQPAAPPINQAQDPDVVVRFIPERPFPLASQYLELNSEQAEALGALRRQHQEERNELTRRLDKKLNEEYSAKIIEMLDGEARALFEKIIDIVTAYHGEVEEADAQLRLVWEETFGEPGPARPPGGVQQLVRVLPGMSDEARRDMARTLWRGRGREGRERLQQEAGRLGIVPPADREDREAWNVYNRRLQTVRERIQTEIEAENVQRLKDAVEEPLRPKVDAIIEAMQVHRDALETALRAAGEKLKEIVPPDRLRPSRPSQRPFNRPVDVPRAFDRGDRGNRAPR